MEDYIVLEKIGTGTHGNICKIKRKIDNKQMVWKEMEYGKMEDREKQQLVSEVNILRELKHPNIVRYYDRLIDKQQQKIFIIMELCEGGDLLQLIRKTKRDRELISEEQVCRIFMQLVLALHEIHRRKEGTIIHRDIKPANVFLDSQNNIKLGDFGISKILQQNDSFAYTNVGTPFYIAPEQLEEAKYSEKTDIWALGCLLYELCALIAPFQAQNQLSLAMKIRKGEFERLPYKYSDEMQRVICWCLSKNSQERPSVDDLLNLPQISIRLRERRLRDNQSVLQKRMDEFQKREESLVQQEKLLKTKEKELEELMKTLIDEEKKITKELQYYLSFSENVIQHNQQNRLDDQFIDYSVDNISNCRQDEPKNEFNKDHQNQQLNSGNKKDQQIDNQQNQQKNQYQTLQQNAEPLYQRQNFEYLNNKEMRQNIEFIQNNSHKNEQSNINKINQFQNDYQCQLIQNNNLHKMENSNLTLQNNSYKSEVMQNNSYKSDYQEQMQKYNSLSQSGEMNQQNNFNNINKLSNDNQQKYYNFPRSEDLKKNSEMNNSQKSDYNNISTEQSKQSQKSQLLVQNHSSQFDKNQEERSKIRNDSEKLKLRNQENKDIYQQINQNQQLTIKQQYMQQQELLKKQQLLYQQQQQIKSEQENKKIEQKNESSFEYLNKNNKINRDLDKRIDSSKEIIQQNSSMKDQIKQNDFKSNKEYEFKSNKEQYMQKMEYMKKMQQNLRIEEKKSYLYQEKDKKLKRNYSEPQNELLSIKKNCQNEDDQISSYLSSSDDEKQKNIQIKTNKSNLQNDQKNIQIEHRQKPSHNFIQTNKIVAQKQQSISDNKQDLLKQQHDSKNLNKNLSQPIIIQNNQRHQSSKTQHEFNFNNTNINQNQKLVRTPDHKYNTLKNYQVLDSYNRIPPQNPTIQRNQSANYSVQVNRNSVQRQDNRQEYSQDFDRKYEQKFNNYLKKDERYKSPINTSNNSQNKIVHTPKQKEINKNHQIIQKNYKFQTHKFQ